jgi:hypothetical protein
VYKGNFADGHLHGFGTVFLKGKKSKFNGEFQKGDKVRPRDQNEEGEKEWLTTESGQYEGKFKYGLMHD